MPLMPPAACEHGPCKAYAVPGTHYCVQHSKPPDPNGPQKADLPPAPKPWWHVWYHRAQWRNLRTLLLARDPVCRICNRRASTIADHIIPYRGNWDLFCDMSNLQGLCEDCHNTKTANENGGFGNPTVDPNAPAMTGDEGKQFSSGSRAQQQDKALEGVEGLLDVQLPGAK